MFASLEETSCVEIECSFLVHISGYHFIGSYLYPFYMFPSLTETRCLYHIQIVMPLYKFIAELCTILDWMQWHV